MRIAKFFSIFLLVLGYQSMIQGFELDISEQFNNYHIDQVVTTEEGVFLLVEDQWIGAEGILAMPGSFLLLENGRWVSVEEVVSRDTYNTWRCRVCGYINPQGVTRCLNSKNHPK